ncbi:MAG: prevent-host-death protein [Deltaproteobacteria bacterium 21-66-5]|nr:MAG: prevent-host-death protein [Deltaproteobacteria bacterium 21-66-5]HQU44452.1 type II toxin-antitoxin system prevent-host-death family antitoxin [Pirellulales bacterium]
MRSVGAYQAKTHLPRLLDQVERGEEIQITRNGKPVARLVPEPAPVAADLPALIAEMRKFREGRRLGDDLTVRDLIEEGRRL